jgi:AraC-like DNA-binding protein
MSGPRSTDPLDYQAVPRPVAAMAKDFPNGFHIAPHSHTRDQLLYSVSGTMRVHTGREAWIVPPDRAVYIPAHVTHAIDIRGEVAMRTIYLVGDMSDGLPKGLPTAPTVLEVSDLLRALILALIAEPVLYDEAGRGGAIATLILSEIATARPLPLVLPMPRDPRLLRVCAALLADPSRQSGLDAWADMAGASPRTLARLFERELGLTFSVWRQRVRFHNALEALVNGEPVGLIAERNGYRSVSAFSAAFRRTMGFPPSALRDGV